jgi:ABC-type transporter Mla MlaB component
MPKRRATAPKPKRASVLTLAVDCRVAQISELRAALSRALPRASPVELDGSAVQQIDAASLQLIAAFVRERQSNGRSVAWREGAPIVAQASQRLGLAALLGMEPA